MDVRRRKPLYYYDQVIKITYSLSGKRSVGPYPAVYIVCISQAFSKQQYQRTTINGHSAMTALLPSIDQW